MSRRILSTTTAIVLLMALTAVAHARITAVPAPFKDASSTSTYSINYDDVTNVLRYTVVNTGRSSRDFADPPVVRTGTRMRQTVNRATVNEGNRLYYELFQGSDDATAILHNIKKGLEAIPSQVTLAAFSRYEQLAYWLNLYNVTLIDEIIKIYPKRNLKKVLVGEKSILDKKTLNVAGIPLSLNDIEFILWENYNGDPTIVYGLYQGIIGGPNIRRVAYTAENVYTALDDNAREFTNSNRGTFAKDEKTFRVSSLYKRDSLFFDSDEALKKHLLRYLDGPEREELKTANRIKRDIDDWSITDMYGSSRNLAASMADSRAALMDMTKRYINPSLSLGVNYETPGGGRYSQDLLLRLREVNDRRIRTAEGHGTVTLEELGAVEVESENSDTDNN